VKVLREAEMALVVTGQWGLSRKMLEEFLMELQGMTSVLKHLTRVRVQPEAMLRKVQVEVPLWQMMMPWPFGKTMRLAVDLEP
jgi:hypothetical protein